MTNYLGREFHRQPAGKARDAEPLASGEYAADADLIPIEDELSPAAKAKQEENRKLAEEEEKQHNAREKYLNSVKPRNKGNRN
jgi:hypothetical protein